MSSAAAPVSPPASYGGAVNGAYRDARPLRSTRPPLGLRSRQSDFGQDLLHLGRGAGRRKEAIDNQMREAVDEAPGGHSRKIVVERPRVELGDAAHQHRLDGRACRLQGWVFRPLGENGPEHEAKKAAVLAGELDISKTATDERVAAPGRALHRRSELVETLGRDGSEEIFLVGEMAIGGRRRHADA